MCKENLRKLESSRFRPYCAACVVSLLQLMFGMCIGWMSPATIGLESYPPQIVHGDPLTTDQINWLSSVTFIGCIVGILFWGSVAEKIGRKNTLRLLALPVIMGWTLISLAKTVKLMYLGRFILGLSGVGAIVPIQLYLNEISEPSHKGTLTSVMVFFFNGGIAMSYILGAILSLRNFTLVCNIIPFLYLAAFHFFPESPVYLHRKNKTKQAEMSLLWFRNNNYMKVQEELVYLEENMTYGKKSNMTSLSSLYEGRARSYALMINVWLFIVSQFCGILVMLTYTSSIIKSSGTTLIEPDNGAVIVGILQLILSWMTTLILEKTSRKLLLMLSMGGMFISQALLGLYHLGDDTHLFPNWLPVVCICLHVGCYTFGVGPVAYVISAEITHPKIQPTAFSLFCFLGTAASFVSIKIYPYLIHYVGEHGCFWFYASWCLVSMVLIPKFLPETRGKTFEQITELLGKNQDNYHQCVEVRYDVHSKQIDQKV
uniref:Sugar transporter n=1 Tax=Nilaparvata lugens TaxID=108931 RepID=A0A0A8JAG5_NILLU|nr:sugar transporter [Nilaparvata lugens]